MSWHYRLTTAQYQVLTNEEMQENAVEFYNYFTNRYGNSITLEAICGMLGNIHLESVMNPGSMSSNDEYDQNTGWGLIQWTPPTDLTNWITSKQYSTWCDGAAQCELIGDEGDGNDPSVSGRWLITPDYQYTWAEFLLLTSVDEATAAYCFERERAGVVSLATRQQYAQQWYTYLSGVINPFVPPTPPTPTRIKKMPLWMMLKKYW